MGAESGVQPTASKTTGTCHSATRTLIMSTIQGRLEVDLFTVQPPDEAQPAHVFYFSLRDPEQRTQLKHARLPTHRHCGIMSLWSFVT